MAIAARIQQAESDASRRDRAEIHCSPPDMALSEHRESLEHHEAASPGSGQADTSRAELDAALRAVDVAKGRERHLELQVEKLEARLLETDLAGAEREKEVARLLDLVDEIQHTRSWRWTAPFRVIRRTLPF